MDYACIPMFGELWYPTLFSGPVNNTLMNHDGWVNTPVTFVELYFICYMYISAISFDSWLKTQF